MWLLYLLLSLQVMMIKSLPMYLPEILPHVQSPLPLLQEELLRLQAMQLQHISDMQQLQTVPVMQHPYLQDLHPIQAVQPMQHLQHLQNLQQLQAVSDMQQLQVSPANPMNQVHPIIVLLPGGLQNNLDTSKNVRKNVNHITTTTIKDKKEHKKTDDDLESITIEAEEPIPTLEDQKAILLLPDPRFTINGIISAIPFLPFEINVPDTIAWMYNGIISIIGQIQNLQNNRLRLKNIEDFGKLKEIQRPIIIVPL